MALIDCPECGKQISDKAKACPECGYPILQEPQEPQQSQQPTVQLEYEDNTKKEKKKGKKKEKKKHGIIWKICVGFVALVVIFALFGNSSEDDSGNNQQVGGETSQASDTPVIQDIDTSDYMEIDADLLYQYGEYLSGEKVVTVITISSTSSNELKANTSSNESLTFSFIFKFSDENALKGFQEDEEVTIAGIVDGDASSSSTIWLKDCAVIGYGEILDEIEGGVADQQAICDEKKSAYETEIVAAQEAERDEYASQCKSISYNDVARNPDTYKGEKITITGKVIQVQEGWLDSATYRIDCNGNTWYVTYTHKDGESRILENDTITAYGECDGVETYTSVLGSSVTIPSMKMKYYK